MKKLTIVLSIILLFSVQLFCQDSTSYYSPSTYTGVNWEQRDNVYVSDNNDAYEYYSGYPDSQQWGDFGISLNPDYTVTGIKFSIEWASGETGLEAFLIIQASVDDGSTWSTIMAGDTVSTTSSTDIFSYLGNSSDDWGLTLTPSNIQDLAIYVTTFNGGDNPYTTRVDHIQAKIYYTVPAAGYNELSLFINGNSATDYLINDGSQLTHYLKGADVVEPETYEPRIIFAEDFENVTDIDGDQRDDWNLVTGSWEESHITLYSTGTNHGNVMKINFTTTDINGLPMANTKLLLDSVYHRIYMQYKVYVSSGFDFNMGGKTFGGFQIAEDVHIPYYGDTVNTGGNTLVMFQSGGYMEWYNYTHNGNGYAITLTEDLNMPSSSRPQAYGSINGSDYHWFYNTYTLGTPTGYWASWPALTTWNSGTSTWDYASSGNVNGQYTPGSWQTFTYLIDIDSEGGFHDIFAIWKDGENIFYKDDNRYRIMDNLAWGVESGYWNAFFGGGGTAYAPPFTEYWYIDDIVYYVLPSGHEDYGKTTESITPISFESATYLTSPAVCVDETYTDNEGFVFSNNRAFHAMLDHKIVDKWITPTGATHFWISVQQFAWSNENAYRDPSLEVIKYVGGTPTTVVTYDGSYHTTGVAYSFDADSVNLRYYTGGKPPISRGQWGFSAYYNSDAPSSSGGNPQYYQDPAEMVATKP